jgi:hypothetical protein
MPSPENRPPQIVDVGPTGVGNTALTNELPRRSVAGIRSAESRLI